ncbi:hypothetical protein QZH41_000353 [Actinostola sp. cb2023]|nr:hypothetical protein QZH41_000353 [Actinostola sp. cb2023]
MRIGNEIHDELFDCEAVNVSVDEAIEAVGERFKIGGIDEEFNVFGKNALNQFETVVEAILQKTPSYHVAIVAGMAILIIIDSRGTATKRPTVQTEADDPEDEEFGFTPQTLEALYTAEDNENREFDDNEADREQKQVPRQVPHKEMGQQAKRKSRPKTTAPEGGPNAYQDPQTE